MSAVPPGPNGFAAAGLLGLPADPLAAPMLDPMLLQMQADDAAEAAAEASREEEAAVKKWADRITEAREFDKNPRARYAIDRLYTGGEAGRAGFDVSVNIAGTYADILVAFLYAKDPAVDVVPEESVGPSRTEEARLLGKTMEIVIKKSWQRARLKAAMRPMVRSGVSVGIGWLKVAWHQRAGQDPTTATRIADLQDNLARLRVSQQTLAMGEADDPEALAASIQSQIEGLQAGLEVVQSRGFVADFIAAEDVQVSPECARLENYLDAPWIAHRSFMPFEEAKAFATALTKEELAAATMYTQVTPPDPNASIDASKLTNVNASDADSFTPGDKMAGLGGKGTGTLPGHVCVWEIQSREDGMIYTLIEGTKKWARPPTPPHNATTRFYNLFQWAPIQVDGKRHPQSLTERAAPLLDEYNRIRSNKREHRRRAIPKLGFNRRRVSPEDAQKMEGGGIGEMIGLDIMGEEADKSPLYPIEYNRIDPALYDTSEVRSELEMTYGIQEALSSTIRTAKTLGEAEIQQSGTEAREGFKRDGLEEMLTDLAIYTAEIALLEYRHEEVQQMAGPEAFWPSSPEAKLTVEDLASLVNVQIRAGSSGKPDTRLRQEQWAQLMPILERAIETMAMLQQSNPLDTARCIRELVVETLERTGDRLDPERFLPPPGQPVMLIDPATGQPVLAYPAPAEMQPRPPAAGPGGAPPGGPPAGPDPAPPLPAGV